MKFRGPIFFSIILVALVFGAFYIPANNAEKEAILIKSIIANLDRFHFQPQKVDNDFSEKVYNLYLTRIDGNRRWLTQQDIDRLGEFEMKLDDEADAGTYEFFDMSLTLLENGLNKTEIYFKEILSEPFDFSIDESIDLSDENKPFAKNDAELKENWRKYLKRETLTRLVDDLDLQKEGKDEDLKGKSFADLEQKAREDVLDVFDKWYTRMRKLKRVDRLSNYLNAVANVYDPHTGYFKPRDKENFDIRMSKTLEGIGAQLRAEEEYTRVVSIIVGGPAWK